MTPAQERELRDKITETLGLVRAVAGTQARHTKKLDRLDERQDATDVKLASFVGLPERLTALERWRYATAGAYTMAGVIAGYLANWLVHR